MWLFQKLFNLFFASSLHQFGGLDPSTITTENINTNGPAAIVVDGFNNNNHNKMQCGISPYEPTTTFLGTESVGFDKSHFGIINGHEVLNATFLPWMAIMNWNSMLFMCTSTIIGPSHILTAGHCVFIYYYIHGYKELKNWPPVNTGEFMFTVGTVNRSDLSAIVVRSAKIIPHPLFEIRLLPSYSLAIFNDIAIIELETPLNFTDTIRPVCLSAGKEDGHNHNTGINVAKNVTATLVGWGKTKPPFTPESLDPILRAGQTVISADQSICKNSTYFDAKKNVCTISENGKMATVCAGDSGGPLLTRSQHSADNIVEGYRWTQVGITSSDISKDGCGSPGIFTRISYFCDWISNATEKSVSCI